MHRQPIRKEKEQKLLEEVKMNRQKTQEQEKKLEKQERSYKMFICILNKKAMNENSWHRMLKDLLPSRR